MNYYNNRGGFMSGVPTAVKNIIIINVLVMVMTYLNEPLMLRLFALYPFQIIFHPWQLVTYMFMHGGFFHLFFNMYTLYIFGSVLDGQKIVLPLHPRTKKYIEQYGLKLGDNIKTAKQGLNM